MIEQVEIITEHSRSRVRKLLWIPLAKGTHLALYDHELASGLTDEMFQLGISRAKAIKRRRERERRQRK